MTAARVGAVLAVAIAALAFRSAAFAACVVAVDVGHSESQPGAVSARGVGEHAFNRNVARLLLEDLQRHGLTGSFIVEAPGDGRSLTQRTRIAERRHANFFISIHHDSVQPSYLSTWWHGGVERRYSDRFSGFSLFVSRQGRRAPASLALARAVGGRLLDAGFHPSLHHAEKIVGEGRDLVDRERGVYGFDELVVLRTAAMPAVLLECGIIVNRDEEVRLLDRAYQARLVSAVAAGIAERCAERDRE